MDEAASVVAALLPPRHGVLWADGLRSGVVRDRHPLVRRRLRRGVGRGRDHCDERRDGDSQRGKAGYSAFQVISPDSDLVIRQMPTLPKTPVALHHAGHWSLRWQLKYQGSAMLAISPLDDVSNQHSLI